MTNKTNKTNRKNKTNQTVKWPTSHFTIEELNTQNADFVNITLRVRLKSAIDEKQVVELGVMHASKGRPKLVFAYAPVAATVIESARTSGIMLHESFNSVKVATMDGQQPMTATTQTATVSTPVVVNAKPVVA